MGYEKDNVLLKWRNVTGTIWDNGITKSDHYRELNAYLIYNRTGICNSSETDWRGNFSCLQVDLLFSRDDAFYFSTVFIPSIILVTSSFITFWLEWNAVPARVMIGVTTMLNFFTTSNSFRSTLPVVSNLAAMNLWDSVCMFFIYVSLLEFVVVNYVGRKRPKNNMAYMPGENAVIQRIPQAIHRIGLSLTERKRSDGSHEDSTGLPRPQPDDIASPNRNSHELVSCANCGNSQCSHSNATNNCPNGEEHNEISQVEYTFSSKASTSPLFQKSPPEEKKIL
ncbi:Glutamate-gated chloride channel [Armadillidium vulgare]|nr:Glutamate-gated chloride channel [Armadillidium vulgare]